MWNLYFVLILICWAMVLKGAFSKVAQDRREEAWGNRSFLSVWIKMMTFQKCPKKTEVSREEFRMRVAAGLFAIIVTVGSIWITYKFFTQQSEL